jgi:glycosyltransferase involved in cell wall biosynthesis
LGAPPSRVHTILNGCDRSIFSQQDTVAARRRLGFPEDAELVLFVGHLIRDKGIGDLIEAWERLSGKRRRLRLAFIGEGSMESSLRKLDQERVLLLGPKTAGEVAQWLAACNLLCLPSYSEGCPNVVLEALACGRPVVATTVGAIPDLLDDTCGIQVPPGNARALKNALAEALESSWDSSLIARRHGRGWQDAAAETLEVCRRAARLSAPPG